MSVIDTHAHREECHCTECNEWRAEREREAAAERAKHHRADDARWDDDKETT